MELWNSNYFNDTKDIEALVNNKTYELNSDILFISDIMREIFTGTRFLESKNEIKEIYDVNTDTWELFLNFIYSIYIKNYLAVLKKIDIQILDLEKIDVQKLLDLIVFADKIIAPQLVFYISNILFKNVIDKILFKLEDEKLYSLYEDILSYIDPDVLILETYSFSDTMISHTFSSPNTIPVYNTDKVMWSFDFDNLLKYPHLMYYVLVLLSYYDMPGSNYINTNILFKNNSFYPKQELGEVDVDGIMNRLGIRRPFKTTQPKNSQDSYLNYGDPKYIRDSMDEIINFVLYDPTHRNNK